jgi:exosortase E/protease (VPEID-CTERM system)
MPLPESFVSGAWIALAAITGVTAGLIVLTPRQWAGLLSRLRVPLAGIAGAAAIACLLGIPAARLWEPLRWLTFTLVQKVLTPIVPTLLVQPERFRIATGRFGVVIAPECSGLEGIGLLLIFGVLWTAAFHRALGMARCAAFLAVASIALYGLNVLRIAALVLIGHAGFRDIAQAGFHSQAGWIAFSSVALCLTFLGRWVADRSEVEEVDKPAADNAAEPLLVPFLATVAAGMVSGAFSGGFEWLYGLRVAAGGALWWYRHEIRRLPWRAPGAPAALAGLAAFALWIGFERVLTGTAGAGQSAPAQIDSALGWCWVAVRIFGAVVTVPMVEELAFRGYLLRRFQSANVDEVPFRGWTVFAAVSSSVLFGCLHGSRWAAGIAAGLLYSWASTRRGNLADAVVAHAITNALIAAFVLFAGAWRLW